MENLSGSVVHSTLPFLQHGQHKIPIDMGMGLSLSILQPTHIYKLFFVESIASSDVRASGIGLSSTKAFWVCEITCPVTSFNLNL